MARGDAASAVDKDRAPTASEKAHLKELVSGIVLAQGNVFIKELLRDKGLTIGRTKEDFARHLAAAVDGGDLQLEDVEPWLAQVEGWGEQHIYLWRLPASLVPDGLFTSEPLLRRRLGRAGLEPLLGAPSTLAFPDQQELTGIRQADDSIRFVWHKGQETWERTKDHDKQPAVEDDGEVYRYEAYRQRRDRTVMRLELHREPRLAAAFLQVPWNRAAHEEARSCMARKVKAVVDIDKLEPVGLSDAVKRLAQDSDPPDSTADGPANLKPIQARLDDGLAAVAFESLKKDHAYTDSTIIRQAWRALRRDKLTATMGLFTWVRPAPLGAVRFGLFSLERRIHVRTQLRSSDVWDLLGRIVSAA